MSGTTDDRATNVQDAINLYEIGRFLEFNFLAQACEDLLMQLMSVENVVTILNWSLKPHGSAWISRQALQFLEEEFFNVSNKMEVLGSLLDARGSTASKVGYRLRKGEQKIGRNHKALTGRETIQHKLEARRIIWNNGHDQLWLLWPRPWPFKS